jgi:hypothetical protein
VGADVHGRVHCRRQASTARDGDCWFVDETYVKVRWPLDLSLPCGRSVRPDHRRAGLRTP